MVDRLRRSDTRARNFSERGAKVFNGERNVSVLRPATADACERNNWIRKSAFYDRGWNANDRNVFLSKRRWFDEFRNNPRWDIMASKLSSTRLEVIFDESGELSGTHSISLYLDYSSEVCNKRHFRNERPVALLSRSFSSYDFWSERFLFRINVSQDEPLISASRVYFCTVSGKCKNGINVYLWCIIYNGTCDNCGVYR